MSKFDLTTTEGKEEALKDLNCRCLEAFKESGIKLEDNTMIVVHNRSILIGLRKDDFNFEFGSKIKIYSEIQPYEQENKISIASCGLFDPTDKASYTRILNSAKCLQNWNIICKIVNEFCTECINLYEEMYK